MMLMRLFVALTAALVLTIPSAFAEIPQHKCPLVDAGKSVFDSSALLKDSTVAVEKREKEDSVELVIYHQDSTLCQRRVLARYPHEGSAPTVESVFLFKQKGKFSLFTIVSWNINSRGDGTYGKLYQVYAYAKNSGGGMSENKRVSENSSMTGIDGYYQGRQITFPYKTASDLKLYWRKHQLL